MKESSRAPDSWGRLLDQRGKTPDQQGRPPDQRGKASDQQGRPPDQQGKARTFSGALPDQRGRPPDQWGRACTGWGKPLYRWGEPSPSFAIREPGWLSPPGRRRGRPFPWRRRPARRPARPHQGKVSLKRAGWSARLPIPPVSPQGGRPRGNEAPRAPTLCTRLVRAKCPYIQGMDTMAPKTVPEGGIPPVSTRMARWPLARRSRCVRC